MDEDKMKKLAEPFGQDTVQRTYKEDTCKMYDTTGIGYQFCVNQFNIVCGADGWGFKWEILLHEKGAYRSGQECHTITVKVDIWVGNKENIRSCVGGHIAALYFDALKGAITNGFKKTAAFWGVGRQAYEGTLDDDNQAYPEDNKNKSTPRPAPAQNKSIPASEKLNTPAPAKSEPIKSYIPLCSIKEAHQITAGQTCEIVADYTETMLLDTKDAKDPKRNIVKDYVLIKIKDEKTVCSLYCKKYVLDAFGDLTAGMCYRFLVKVSVFEKDNKALSTTFWVNNISPFEERPLI